jgi:hypothetical protein
MKFWKEKTFEGNHNVSSKIMKINSWWIQHKTSIYFYIWWQHCILITYYKHLFTQQTSKKCIIIRLFPSIWVTFGAMRRNLYWHNVIRHYKDDRLKSIWKLHEKSKWSQTNILMFVNNEWSTPCLKIWYVMLQSMTIKI